MAKATGIMEKFRTVLKALYRGRSKRAARFRFALLTFDFFTISFFVVSSILPDSGWILAADIFIGAGIALDFSARLWLAENKVRYLTQMATIADIIVMVSLLAVVLSDELIFLRVLRALRLLRSYHVLRDLRSRNAFFRRNEEIVQSVVNLAVFVFVVTALVYVLQVHTNPQISNYVDALYFTIATLTTTGFGDITLQGSSGRLLAAIMMVLGVALFLRLVQTIFRPQKVNYKCPDCGLSRHDPDAVHCKHCGRTLNIATEGG